MWLILFYRHKVFGVILVKELAMIDKTAKTPVSTLKMRSLPFLRGNTPLYDLLRLFETGRCHMAVLTEPAELKEGAEFPWVNPADPPSGPHPTEVLQRHHSDGMHAHLMQQHECSDGMQNGYVIQRQASEGDQLISADHDGLVHDEVRHLSVRNACSCDKHTCLRCRWLMCWQRL